MNGTPDLTGQWLNFAQQPVDQGGLGLAPHQAAGLVGNLQNESGTSLSAWGPSGDNGTAWGTAQWRGDRLASLKAMYPDSYQNPQSQMQFMRSEMMGPENNAYKALLSSKTPEEAAAAVNHLYERSADTTGNRERSARALMAQFGSGAGTSGALSLSGDDEDDDDSKPALSTSNTVGQGALSPGGMQTLMPEADVKKNHKWSAGLTGIAAALASISNPQQAYALNSMAKQLKDDDTNTYKVTATKDGRIIRFNPSTGAVEAIGPNAANNDGSAQSPQMVPTWGNTKLLGDDPSKATPEQQEAFLGSMQGSQGAMVRGILDNTLPPPTAAAMARKDSPYPAAFAAARAIDPTVDPNAYSGRVAGYRDWATKGAESARALNQTIAHQSEALIGAMKGLNNGDTPLLNDGKNWWSEHVSGSGAVPAFRTSAHAVVDELGKVFKQNNLSDTEIRKWEENLPSNMSPAQQRAQVNVFGQLMHGAMQALEDKRKQAIGTYAASKARPLLSAEGQAGLAKLQAFSAEPSAAATTTAINHDAIDAELRRRGLH